MPLLANLRLSRGGLRMLTAPLGHCVVRSSTVSLDQLAPTVRTGLAAVATAVLLGCASAGQDAPWPTTVVGIDQMRTTAPLTAAVLTKSPDKTKTTTVVVVVHVDAEGQPVRWRLEQSSGNARIDEAGLHSIRAARFAPYLVDGKPQEVTVVAPMHFPFADRSPR